MDSTPVIEPEPGFKLVDAISRPIEELMFDEPGDGFLWARGMAYKASFGGQGATVIPFFGSEAPQNYPLELRVQSARVGTRELAFESSNAAVRDGNIVRIDRGAFVEEYELTLEQLEQRFVFAQRPGKGDLVVEFSATTELSGRLHGNGLRFENELGHIDYSGAFALDARGRKLPLERTSNEALQNGRIELRVPAAFLETSEFPVVIDPIVTFFISAGGFQDEFSPDAAYDVSSNQWCIVSASVFSATDYDIVARLVDGSGVNFGSYAIDITTANWARPAIANNNSANSFLVCAMITNNVTGVVDIRGRMTTPSPLTLDSPFQISTNDSYCGYPDVGGEVIVNNSSFFCVTWHHIVSATNSNIEYQLITPTGQIWYPLGILESGPEWHEFPQISNTTGVDIGDDEHYWTITWQRRKTSTNYDIFAAQVKWNSTIHLPMFPVDISIWHDTRPAVSSPMYPTFFSGPRTYMIVFERWYGPDRDLFAAVMLGSTVLQVKNLTLDFPSQYILRDQQSPSVDTDGEMFFIGFDERLTSGDTKPDVYISSYYWTNGLLAPSEIHQSFASSPEIEGEIVVSSEVSGGGQPKKFLGTWVQTSPLYGFDTYAGLWAGAGGWVTSFCPGDGTGTPCPCGNSGASGRGCANAVNSTGALLSTTGDADLSADTLQFQVTGISSGVACLIFQTLNTNSGVPLGDGLLCAIGGTIRFPVKFSVQGSIAYPENIEATIHVVGQVTAPGETRYYQAWYRDPGNFCTSSAFNLSNGLRVMWVP